jgi:quercetin dioxygenase-like cupin family protein
MSKSSPSRTLWHGLALAGIIAGTLASASTAFAGECPAEKMKANVREKVDYKPVGVTDVTLGAISLEKQPANIKDRELRFRKLTIEPGGIVPWHSHDDRPALIYVQQGEIVEYASNCAEPIIHKAGEIRPEVSGTSHWWKNLGKETVILYVGDVCLPSERELSDMLDVSRTALREAIRSLENAGIVEMRKGSRGGAFITRSGAGQVTRTFRDMLDFGQVSLATLLEARLLVMDAVVRAACVRAKPADIERLSRNVAETVELTRQGRYEDRTPKAVEFSTLLANSTGNQVMSAILEAMASVALS